LVTVVPRVRRFCLGRFARRGTIAVQ
jgi:hypothetical protein